MAAKKSFQRKSDEPILSSEDDRFGRRGFAEALAESLINVPDSQSFTVGLYGAWGMGKTSVINMAKQHLADAHKDDVVIVTFNPWVFSNAENLHTAFFGTLANALDKKLQTKKESIAAVLREYSQLTGSAEMAADLLFPRAKTYSKITASFLEHLPFAKSRSSSGVDGLSKRVDKILAESNKRVVVIIDDIDRLDSEEIHEIFKLVKNVARFKNVSYLLSFDLAVVTEALSKRYPRNSDISSSFVDKIVQLPLSLPPVDPAALSQYLLDQIEAIGQKHKVKVSEDEISRFQQFFFSNGVEKYLTTPRKVNRYLNMVDFSLERLANEVNYTDLLLVDLLRSSNEKVYERIALSQKLMLKQGILGERDEAAKAAFQKGLFGEIVPSELDSAIVQELFPTIDWAYGRPGYGDVFLNKWAEERRICTDKYFSRYFNYGIPPGDIADAKIDQLITLLSSPKTTQAVAVRSLKHLMSESDIPLLISKLRLKEDQLPTEAGTKLAPALVAVSDSLPRAHQAIAGDSFSAYVQSAVLAVRLTRNAEDTPGMLEKLIKNASIDYAAQLLRWIRVNSENDENDPNFQPLISAKQLERIGKTVAERIESYATVHYLEDEFPEDTSYLMWIWEKWGGKQDIADYLTRDLQNDPNRAITFLSTYVGTEWELTTGKVSRAEFRRESYNLIADVVDPEVFVKPLVASFGEDVNTGSFMRRRSDTSKSADYQTAQQFLYIHRQVLKEHAKPQDPPDVIEGEIVSSPPVAE